MMYYDHLMALVTTTVNGEILAPVTNVPAVGTVTFKILTELRDTVTNIVYSPQTFTATLDLLGQFSIVLPYTDNADITPVDWTYWVYVDTDVWTELFYISLPTTLGDPVDFADLTPISSGDGSDCTPDGTACAPISVVGQIAALQAELDSLELIVAALQVDVAANTADIIIIQGQIVVIQGQIAALQAADIALDLAKVNRSGDTMTGDLIINADLTVTGITTTSYAGITGDITEMMSTALGTGVISGGVLSINVNPTLIDISAMVGYIVDYNSSAPITPTNPSLVKVSTPAQVGLALTGPPTQLATWWLVDSAGTFIQQAFGPTNIQNRTHIVLGATPRVGGVIIVAQSIPTVLSQIPNQLVDLMQGLGPFSTTGNILSANGANLTVNKTAGTLFIRAFSQISAYQNPNASTLPAQIPCTFRRATATTVLAPLQTTIDVGNYDPAGLGVVTPVGGGANTSTNFRIYGFGTAGITDQIAVQYGQNTYSSLANAVAGIGSGNYIPNPAFAAGALLGWVTATRTAVDLSNVTQALFTPAARFAAP
jgi:hypothetical protein